MSQSILHRSAVDDPDNDQSFAHSVILFEKALKNTLQNGPINREDSFTVKIFRVKEYHPNFEGPSRWSYEMEIEWEERPDHE